jgi:hypothetical protein
MRRAFVLALPWLACGLAPGAQEESSRSREEVETDHFLVSGRLDEKTWEELERAVEELYEVWARKLGKAAEPAGKLRIKVHVERDAFHKEVPRGRAYLLKEGALHLLAGPAFFQELSAGGSQLYLGSVCPAATARDDVYREAFQFKGKALDVGDLEREWKAYVKTLRVRK